MNNLVNFINELQDVLEENKRLKSEVLRLSEYEEKYNMLLRSTLEHNQVMADNQLMLILNGLDYFKQ